MSKGQAETIMASILEPLNETAGTRQPRAFTFKQYVEDVYLPVCRRKWKESTRITSEPTISGYLVPQFGDATPRTTGGVKRATLDIYEAVPYVAGKCSVIAIMGWPPEITRYRRTRQSLSGAV